MIRSRRWRTSERRSGGSASDDDDAPAAASSPFMTALVNNFPSASRAGLRRRRR